MRIVLAWLQRRSHDVRAHDLISMTLMYGRFLLLSVDGFSGLLWKRERQDTLSMHFICMECAFYLGVGVLPVDNLSIGICQQPRVWPLAIQDIVHLITQLCILYKQVIDPRDEYTEEMIHVEYV